MLEAVRAVADELEVTPAQVAFRWAMDVEGVTSVPIVGARSRGQLRENVGALALSDEHHDRIADAGRETRTGSWSVYGE